MEKILSNAFHLTGNVSLENHIQRKVIFYLRNV